MVIMNGHFSTLISNSNTIYLGESGKQGIEGIEEIQKEAVFTTAMFFLFKICFWEVSSYWKSKLNLI